MKNGGAAFPVLDNFSLPNDGRLTCVDGGMSLRDYFAGQALSGLLADTRREAAPEDYARIVYVIADAMLTERQKSK